MAKKKSAAKKTTSKTAKKAVKKTTQKAVSKKTTSKKAPTKKTAAKKQDPELDPKAKDLMLSARKRKSTPAIFKIRKNKNTPILFTLSDVKDIIEKRKHEESQEQPATKPKPAAPRKAAAKPSKKIEETELPKSNNKHGAASITDILGFNPKKKEQPRYTQVDESKIPKKFMSNYKDLLDLRDHLLTELDLHTKETLHRSSREDSGDLSNYSQHMADAGTDNFDRDFALSLVSSEQEALQEVESSLKRLEAGTYGVCEITGKVIKKERLRAVPFTRYSLEGQQELERQRRRTVERGGVFADASEEDSVQFSDDDD